MAYGLREIWTEICTGESCMGRSQVLARQIKEKEKPAISSPRPLPQLATPSRLRTGLWVHVHILVHIHVHIHVFVCVSVYLHLLTQSINSLSFLTS